MDLTRRLPGLPAAAAEITAFAAEVGPPSSGPVHCVGGRTQWGLGGEAVPAREVSAPARVVSHEPGEMIVRVRAGTPLAELQAELAAGGQYVALEAEEPERATVGGVLACGHSGIRRLGRGPVRDTVLEVTAVTASGDVVRAGAPLVKNVTGYDLCRLFVGSFGSLAFLAEVVLRCQPVPEVERWWQSDTADPFAVLAGLFRPLSVLWDGTRTWVGLAGYGDDVDAQARRLLTPAGFEEVPAPPSTGTLPRRRSVSPAALRDLPGSGGAGSWLAEVGVGVVHCDEAGAFSLPVPAVSVGITALHRRLKERFDPSGRLNPGRDPLAGAGAVGAVTAEGVAAGAGSAGGLEKK